MEPSGRVREIALLLSLIDPQGEVAKGTNPLTAYTAEAYSLTLLEQQHTKMTENMVKGVFAFWSYGLPAWQMAKPGDMERFLRILDETKPY